MNRLFPVGLIRSPIRIGSFPNSTAPAKLVTMEKLFSVTAGACLPFTTSLRAAIWAGVVPQQPPTMETPAFRISFMARAKSSGPIS